MANPAEVNDLVDSSKVVFFRLFNKKQNTIFEPKDFELTNVVLDLNNFERNTTVDLVPLASSGFYGVRKLRYKRLDISSFIRLDVNVQFAATIADVLQSINNKYKIALSVSDVIDSSLVSVNGSNRVVYARLKVTPDNLIFYGEIDLFVTYDISRVPNKPSLVNFDLDLAIGGSILYRPSLVSFDLDVEIGSTILYSPSLINFDLDV